MQPEPEPEIRLEDFPDTHDGAVDFVAAIFQSMGGTVISRAPPRRPRRSFDRCRYNGDCDDFMCDFENLCLERHWDSSVRSHPTGPKRYEDKEWAEMIQSQVYPHNSCVDWYEYVEWVRRGGGDEWFQEVNEQTE